VAANQNDISDPPPYLLPDAYREEIKSAPNKFDYHKALSTDDDNRENVPPPLPQVPAAAYTLQETPAKEIDRESYLLPPPPETADVLPPPPVVSPPPQQSNMSRSVAPPSVAPPSVAPQREVPRQPLPDATSLQANQSPSSAEFEVRLIKTPEMARLGVSVDTSEKDCLIVDKVEGGMMAAWNNANPGAVVMKGDRIMEVCGVRGDNASMTVACRSNDVLVMRVVRR
jgi:hypothetical protein